MTFTYTVSAADWLGIAPLVVLVVMALVVMLVDLLLPHEGEKSKHSGPANFAVLPIVAFLGTVGAIVAAIILFFVNHPTRIFNSMLAADAGTLYADLVILVAGGLGILLSPAYLKRLGQVHQGEYYSLLLLAMVGMLLMAGATSFLIVFVGLEMFSLALYILCGFIAQRRTSQEAGMKYFLLSSFASAFLLYGIALIYAATGSTFFIVIKNLIGLQRHAPLLLLVGMGLLSVGFAFKVSAVPFQSWTPDVYQGAPAPITAFMSVGTKVAALLAFVRVFGFVLLPVQGDWMPVVWAIAVLTILGGNIMALGQTNIKRMLAYSSIAHGGYLLIGVVVGGALGATAILFYLSCYLFMNLGAFGIVSTVERLDNSGYGIEDLRGLWRRRPVLAGLLAFFLLSLAGFPPMAGFAGKYYIFYAALQGGHPELLIIGIVASILGIYYYLRFIATMFMEQRESTVASIATTPAPSRTPARIATTPRPRSGPTRAVTGGLSMSGGAATAVAVRPASTSASVSKPPVAVEAVAEQEVGGVLLGMTWLALGIAGLGTLIVGVLLPFWLPNLQQAASMLLR
ncbi:MAG: hypothetical protein PVSMB5_13560 [Ktedonobacteraceae bacterium]